MPVTIIDTVESVDSKLYLWSLGLPGGRMHKLNVDKETGAHKPLTKRQFVEWSALVKVQRRPEIFKVVSCTELLDDMKNPLESQYLKCLGWEYAEAMRTAIRQGSVILYTCHPDVLWQYVGIDDFNNDELIAFDIMRMLDESLGDVLQMEEYRG